MEPWIVNGHQVSIRLAACYESCKKYDRDPAAFAGRPSPDPLQAPFDLQISPRLARFPCLKRFLLVHRSLWRETKTVVNHAA